MFDIAPCLLLVVRDGIDQPVILPSAHVAPRFLHRHIIYKNIVSKLLGQTHYSEEKQNDIIITIWAFIHGVTSLATMNNVNYDNDWREKVIDFMDVFQLSFLDNTGEKI